jgi:predicted transcriptional regulator
MQTSVLLSIKPEFVNRIFDGSKLFEFRRKVFKDRTVKTIVIYATAPISQVVGEFDIEGILEMEINKLWEYTKEHSGIPRKYFEKYFSGCRVGFALKIGEKRLYKTPLELEADFRISHPPQSFIYLQLPAAALMQA